MKKTMVSGLAASLISLVIVGCWSPSNSDPYASMAASKGARIEAGQDGRPSELIRGEQKVESEVLGTEQLSCTNDKDCVVIPTDDNDPSTPLHCLPCLEKAGQRAVNITFARSYMAEHKGRCLPFIKQLQEGNQQPQRSQHPDCNYNGAKCINGTCQLANLSEEELKQRMPQGQGGPQAGQQERPLAPQSSAPMGGFGGQQGYGQGQEGYNRLPYNPKGSGSWPQMGNQGQSPYGNKLPYGNAQNAGSWPQMGKDQSAYGNRLPYGGQNSSSWPSAGQGQNPYGKSPFGAQNSGNWPQWSGAQNNLSNKSPFGGNSQGWPSAGQRSPFGARDQGQWPQGYGNNSPYGQQGLANGLSPYSNNGYSANSPYAGLGSKTNSFGQPGFGNASSPFGNSAFGQGSSPFGNQGFGSSSYGGRGGFNR